MKLGNELFQSIKDIVIDNALEQQISEADVLDIEMEHLGEHSTSTSASSTTSSSSNSSSSSSHSSSDSSRPRTQARVNSFSVLDNLARQEQQQEEESSQAR